ncbi:MAG: type III-A CRISPR-associated RAMP protein Csm3 [Schlesneria sp.]
MKSIEHHQITGIIHLLSGTRVGGSDELLDIGATDLTVVKNPANMEPYIPGSSIKGKMRSQLETKFALVGPNGDPFSGRGNLSPAGYLVAAIFGPHMNSGHGLGPTRIIVRDGNLLTGGQLETKSEVMGNRNTGVGVHPRKIERVVAGSTFRLRIDLQVFDLDSSQGNCRFDSKTGGEAMVEFVKCGLKLIEFTGLGSGVSRGSGEVEFLDLKLDGNRFELPKQIPTA